MLRNSKSRMKEQLEFMIPIKRVQHQPYGQKFSCQAHTSLHLYIFQFYGGQRGSNLSLALFFNGSSIISESFFKTTEEQADITEVKTNIETIEYFKENSTGFANQIELLTNINIEEYIRMLFIYCKELNTE